MGNAERAPGEGTAGVTLVGGSEVGGGRWSQIKQETILDVYFKSDGEPPGGFKQSHVMM